MGDPRSLFSTRSSFDPRPNSLSLLLEARRASGAPPCLDLTTSNPTAAGLPYDAAAILASLAPPEALAYEPIPFGDPAARAAVARELGALGRAIDPAHLVLTASTSEAYAFLFKLLCDPGSSVAVPEPSYPLFEHLARYEGVSLSPYRLAYDGAWHADAADLARAVAQPPHAPGCLRGGSTRAILVVSPNNPTGHFTTRAEYAAMERFGLPIVADEVFADYPLVDPSRFVSVRAAAPNVLTFALSGLSKLAALPQMKLGWIEVGGPKALRDEALLRLELLADSFLSVGTPVQHAAGPLLAARQTATGAILDRTRRNLAWLARRTAPPSPATLLSVEAGWYATLRLPVVHTEEEWMRGFVDAGVLVHPGSFFDFGDGAFVVMSLLTPEATFTEGAARLIAVVERECGGPVPAEESSRPR